MTGTSNLHNGYKSFFERYYIQDKSLFSRLSHGQSPHTLFVSCCDSRVDPATITGARPGDLFVIRNVANLVPPFQRDAGGLHGVSAALEFGVCSLKVRQIVVLGHSQCGGIKGLLNLENMSETDFIADWMTIALPARESAIERCGGHSAEPDALQFCCECEGVILSLKNLLTFPWIAERVQAGELTLVGWHFDIATGTLRHYNPENKEFAPI